jgi:hypothetical protein
MEAGRPSQLWTEWGIQKLVLSSFALQSFLLVASDNRRRSSSTLLRIALWFAYLLADSTAIYTLGHLSVGSRSREHQLVPFWASFLLLHLGGPDNITAYSLEDNSLSLRHLQTLTVQVLGAAYVIYKYSYVICGGGTLLLLASLSMFVAGLVKYGERIWALKCGNLSNIRDSLVYLKYSSNPCESLKQDMCMGEEQILFLVQSSFHICKSIFTDFPVALHKESTHELSHMFVMNQYKLVEMEISLMYETLYTKAVVMHTWYGFCIRLLSLLGTATTFLLFELSIRPRRNEYNRVDVAVTYILLCGALALEAKSLCMILLSSWTCSLLESWGMKWHRLIRVLTSLRRRVKPASRRLLSGSIGQYNLFHLCTRDRTKLGTRLAMKVGMEDWWNRVHFSGTFLPTTSLSTQDFMGLVFRAVPKVGQDKSISDLDPRGRSILEERGALKQIHRLTFGIDFNESILTWHIATEMFIQGSEVKRLSRATEHEKKVVKAIKVLSNYMMYLMVVKPDMLPDPRPQNAYADICHYLESQWSGWSSDNEGDSEAATQRMGWNVYYMLKEKFHMLKELFHYDGRNGSRIREMEKLAEMLLNTTPKDKVWLFTLIIRNLFL